jgi:hypothetical protein
MSLCKGTAHSTSVPRQLRRLYKIPKSSRRFEPAFERFYGSVEYEEITDKLDGVGLEEFISFLDEVSHDVLHITWAMVLTARSGAAD